MKTRTMLPLLMLMVVFSPLAIDIFLPALPIMALDLAVDITLMQWSISIFLLTMGLGQLFSGPLADKYGRKPVAIVGISLYMLSAFTLYFTATIESHLLFRSLQGFGSCAISVAAFSIVRDKYNATESGMMYSYLNGFICCIPALAPLLGGWLTNQFNWQSNFMFMALFAVIACVTVAIFLKETNSTPIAKRPNIKVISISQYKSVIGNKIFLFHSVLVMISMAVIIAYVTSAPAWIMIKLGLTQDDFIFWFSVNAVVNILACVTAPKFLKVFGVVKTLNVGLAAMILAGVMLIVLSSSHTAFAFMLPIMMSSIGFCLMMGTSAGQA